MGEQSRLGRLGRMASWHAARGLSVFPLSPATKIPALEKVNWQDVATTDQAQIEQWWRAAPYNIGVATGTSGLLVVDLDMPKNAGQVVPDQWRSSDVHSGYDVLVALAAKAHQELPRTWKVTTPSGGMHLYFRQPDCFELGNSAGRLGWKIDTRGIGGYVVGSGSVVRGQRYRAAMIRRPVPLPDWIASRLASPMNQSSRRSVQPGRYGHTYGLKALSNHLEKLLASANGRRNDDLNFAAYALGKVAARGALEPGTIRDELLAASQRIGLGRREAERTIESGLEAGLQSRI
ncbi:bifunctional DNA primase/polymerase [Kribbella antibiotica]|uniref:Bifunctional DNA primase/polymerase n=1 Tax=Kribbella antibiotica TaxID=190195 RepID=A0A4R4ZUY6_9ACTN|nr:bifunctional DNA primase/polymerase [Kribbella antibiotica]TDD62004.1 bifunctional DNA primase/polymerase [Kribbella antibiotica]